MPRRADQPPELDGWMYGRSVLSSRSTRTATSAAAVAAAAAAAGATADECDDDECGGGGGPITKTSRRQSFRIRCASAPSEPSVNERSGGGAGRLPGRTPCARIGWCLRVCAIGCVPLGVCHRVCAIGCVP